MNKAEKYNIIFIITFMTIGISVLYLNSDNKRYNYRFIESYDFLDTTSLIFENSGKRSIALNDTLKVFNGSFLIENKSNYNEWYDHKPFISFTNEPYRYQIRDVRFPYKVYKKMNSDTIEVFKDTFKLKFKIRKPKKN